MFRIALSFLCTVNMFLQGPRPSSAVLQFQSANPSQVGNEIRFDPFQSINWQQLARRDMKDFNLNHPTRQQVARLRSNLREHPLDESGTSAEVHFASGLEPAMEQGFYFSFSLDGIKPVQLVRLEGTVRYGLNKDKSAIIPDVYYGQVVAKSAGQSSRDIAFIAYSGASLSSTLMTGVKFSARKVEKQDTYLYERDGKKLTLSVQDDGLFDLMSFASYKIGEFEYVIVKWQPDTANHYLGCDRQYSLFVVEQELKLVASNQSSCDV